MSIVVLLGPKAHDRTVERGYPFSVRSYLPVISILGFIGAGVAVTYSVLSRPTDAYITHEVADSFNLQTGPAPRRPPLALAPGETLRDSVAAAPPAASSMMRPIAGAGIVVGAPVKEPLKAVQYTVITQKAEAWAKKQTFFAGLLAKPAAFLMAHSSLGSAKGVRAFLGDPRKVDAYMNSTLVRITINSPSVAKSLLGNTAMVSAFLATPAMRDPATVRALLASPMVKKLLDCPAIQEALSDPAVVRRMFDDPKTMMWVGAHPDAMIAITEAAPAMGDAMNAKAGRPL
jgi:hypothetical protein